MREVFVVSDNIFSPIGSGSAENFRQLKKGVSGIRLHEDENMSPHPFYAALFSGDQLQNGRGKQSRFEQMLIASISDALIDQGPDITGEETIFILSSTKGNISLLETGVADKGWEERVILPHSAALLTAHFHFANPPLIISHACISGSLAIITGMRLLQSGLFKNAVISGADVISQFVLSGFQSFQAISPEPCRPFDAKRKGITLGEGAATLILSTDRAHSKSGIKIISGSVSNDANHISGPSRTGEELCVAIRKTLENVNKNDIDFISAHGTATAYNDEMEAKAITLAGLESIPLNSLKGYYGHTLGAAGLIESIVSIHSLEENIILPTLGFSEPGTTKKINVCNQLQTGSFKTCLKTASGFGGCNAALLIGS